MSDNPDKVIPLKVEQCEKCGISLEDVKAKNHDRRQEFEIPKIKVHIKEYSSEIKECPHCKYENRAELLEGINSKVQYGNYLILRRNFLYFVRQLKNINHRFRRFHRLEMFSIINL